MKASLIFALLTICAALAGPQCYAQELPHALRRLMICS